MKSMGLQELVDLAVVAKLGTTILEVLDPIETCVLEF